MNNTVPSSSISILPLSLSSHTIIPYFSKYEKSKFSKEK